MTTTGDNTRKLYVVSFGDSEKYILAGDKESAMKRLLSLEQKFNGILKEKFPSETFAYYTTPKVTEVCPEHADRFRSYSPLDKAAEDRIGDVLVKEVETMNADRKLNLNAPFNNVNPAAASVGGLL